jgi:hypothetical protein
MERKKQQRQIDRFWREERDLEYRKGVVARKAEHTRKRLIKERLLGGEVFAEDDSILVPIIDTERGLVVT